MSSATDHRAAGRRIVLAAALCASCLLVLSASPAPASETRAALTSAGWRSDDTIGPAAGNQYDPYIERGGDMFLAVWVDERTVVPGDDFEYPIYQDVYAARLDASGALLDETPIVIASEVENEYDPRASWNGKNWLVTWEGKVPGSTAVGVLAARVSPSGQVLDDPPIEVDPDPIGGIDFVATGSNGGEWMVLLKETYTSGMNTETVLRGSRIAAAGYLIGSAQSLFHPSCCYFFSVGGLAYADGVYLLVMDCIPDIYAHSGICGLRITPTLDNLDGYPFEIALTSDVFRTPSAASNGSSFFVGWERYVSYPPTLTDPYAARVTTGGISLDHPDGIELWGGVGSGPARLPTVTWDGTNWIAAWTDNGGARVARIALDGTVLDPGGVSLPGLGANSSTSASGGVRLVWEHSDAGGELPYDVSSVFVSSALSAGTPTDVSVGAPSHHLADVAVGGGDTLLVFRSDISGEMRILAESASDYGGGGKVGATVIASGQQLSGPEVAWNGSLYLITWADESTDTIYATRLLPDGTILDAPAITVMSGLEPDVAAVGSDFLVTGTDEDGSSTVRKPYAARVRGSDGAVLDSSPLTLGQSFARGPRVAGMYDRWIVTWERRPAFDSEEADVWATFVTPSGAVAAEFGIAIDHTTSDRHYAPAVAANPGFALIVWEDTRTYPNDDWNLYGRRVVVTGDVLDDPAGLAIVTEPSDERRAAVAWNGTNFQVAYEVSERFNWFYHTKPDVYGIRVTQNGTLLGAVGFAVESSDAQDVRPAVAGGGGGSLVVTSSFMPGYPYASYRLALAPLGDGTTGVSEVEEPSGTVSYVSDAYPNPSGGGTSLRFVLTKTADVTVSVYDVSGRLVRRLLAGTLPAGEHGVEWDGLDESGRGTAAGVYLFSVEAGEYRGTRKAAVLR